MPVAPNEPHSTPVRPILALAAQLLKAGRPADAIAPLRDAARLQPSDPLIQHDLGLTCLETGLVPEAIAAFERALASNPRYADAYFRLGIAQEKLGDVRSAILAYHRATELLPTLTEAWYRAGALVYTMGHRDEAIGCFHRAAKSGPKTRFGRLFTHHSMYVVNRSRAEFPESGQNDVFQCVRRQLKRCHRDIVQRLLQLENAALRESVRYGRLRFTAPDGCFFGVPF